MNSRKILVIDDEPAILAVIKASLEILGKWEVLTASTGQDGLKKAKTEYPDVILLDMMIPDLDGLKLLQELRNCPTTYPISVILVTGKGQPLEEADYHRLEIAGIMTKPFEPLKLVQKITEILNR